MTDNTIKKSVLLPADDPKNIRLRKWRMFKDKAAKYSISFGGNFVILAIVLIFFYLLYEVWPLMVSPDVEKDTSYSIPAPDAGNTQLLGIEEQSEVAVRFTDLGEAVFFAAADGTVLKREKLALPDGVEITSFAAADQNTRWVSYGLSDGRILVAKHDYRITYPDDKRLITPQILYPMGEQALEIDASGSAIVKLAIQPGEEAVTVVSQTADNRILHTSFEGEESMFSEEIVYTPYTTELETRNSLLSHLLIGVNQDVAYMLDQHGQLSFYRLFGTPKLIQRLQISDSNNPITDIKFLTGGISLMIGYRSGAVEQWFPVRDEEGKLSLTKIRGFDEQKDIQQIAVEPQRKGFIAVDGEGTLAVYHATAHDMVWQEKVTDQRVSSLLVSPRNDAFLVQTVDNKLTLFRADNEHPEVSWTSLWGQVWYESYPEPDYIWQSSSASNDFEPKFSLMPLTFGTLKAAFYAMLFAVPLAIMGAIYTAYFMSPKIRGYVKPTIEIMEALPTVILGFLAGLWLAPLIEANLPGTFAILIVLPVSVLIGSYSWHMMPKRIRQEVPEGWEAVLLVPLVLFATWFAMTMSYPLEQWLFGGDMPAWLSANGMDFDQRNSIVVGLAMGFAVVPTIFSITEDAIFSVPKHLTFGSLALGATRWQTLIKVVILTASPAIFSAVMIGLGRAVGETMIVLMATGNTPIMDMTIFQGMRTLSANIAVEMPEAEVASSHFRILFLSALVLFLFTFIFNTIAELIRQRLRKKYSSL